MSNPFDTLFSGFDWLTWGIILVIGLPLLVVVLGELAHGLKRLGLANWKKLIDILRSSCLFLLFLIILLRMVVGLPGTHLAVKLVETFFWITVLNAALVLFNIVVFETRASEWHSKAPKLLTDLGRIVLVAVGAAFVINHVWGVDLNGLLAALGVGSIVIGLAMQDTLSNLFGGVMLVTVRQFNIGDWIKVGEVEGQVRSISWRAVTVATITGDVVDIPNSQIYSQQLRIYGGDEGRIQVNVDVRFRTAYAPERVKDVLREAAFATTGVMVEPQPEVCVTTLEEGSTVYEVSFWIADYKYRRVVRSEFLSNLWYVSSRQGLKLPGALEDDESSVRERAADANPEHTAAIAARLFSLGTFQRPVEALAPLAAGARIERFRRGETVISSGARGDAAYVVLSGTAQSNGAGEEGVAPARVFAAGDLILFKSFLRGGNSPLNVQGTSDLEVIRIPVSTLSGVLSRDAHLAEQVERLLTLREDAQAKGFARLGNGHAKSWANESDRVQILKDLFRT